MKTSARAGAAAVATFRPRLAAFLLLFAIGSPALALKPVRITPQGEVSQVRQFVVQFDTEAVVAGQANAPAPYTLTCESSNTAVQIPRHHAAWRNAKTWAADFEGGLPPDVQCAAKPVAGFKSPKGEALPPGTIQFKTGAPFIRHLEPSGMVDEQQIFILTFNGDVDAASVQATSSCRAEGIGETLPTVLVDGKERSDILNSRWFAKTAEQHPNRYVLLRCNRTLPASANLTLQIGSYRSTGGQVNKTPRKFELSVRNPFEVEFSCERPNAQAACLPIRPLTLNFSSPISVEQAKKIVLKVGKENIAPTLSDSEAKGSDISSVSFGTLLPEQASLQIVLPADLRDDANRPLRNADSFPLTVKTGPMPPLAKFASAPFGIVERFAEGKNGQALLPISLRNVESGQTPEQTSGKSKLEATLRTLTLASDAEIIRWYRKILRYENDSIVSRKQATKDGASNLPPPMPKPAKGSEEEELPRIDDADVETRAISLLASASGVQSQPIPAGDKASPRPFEMIGIPVQPGFHVLEVASTLLGNSLLDTRYGKHPMYVRTSALVTNLGVHFKLGRENALVWVTTLDGGKPVANAQVAISGCDGKLLANGQTNAQGIWQLSEAIKAPECNSNDDDEFGSDNAVFVSARAADDKGVQDMAFVWSNWDRGIESWRFDVPTNRWESTSLRAHSVLDRSLLRAGETVSMKHYLRAENLQGLAAASFVPDTLRITHSGSGENVELPLNWQTNASGGQNAVNEWHIPKNAKLGEYQLTLSGKNKNRAQVDLDSGSFRVEEFRLPTMTGSVTPADKLPLVALNKLPVRVQLAYINGGAADGLPVQVSASSSPGWLHFPGYDGFTFSKTSRWQDRDDGGDEQEESGSARLLADRLPLKLGKDGSGTVTIENVPASKTPLDITLEASYSDPNGEIQTLQSRQRIWPAAVVVGLRTEGWVSIDKDLKFQALALGTDGKPKANAKISVRAIAHTTVTSRKRLVGGFYTYDNRQSTKDLGSVCSGNSDSRGLLLCNVKLAEPGEIELVATASDESGKTTEASTGVTVTRRGEIWWGGEDHDRMDVLPEKRAYQPGETAKLQVRMPFRNATALLTVEREGILHSEIVQLSGQDPTVELKIRPEWGPNVYVSVLALRGRLYEVPWYSFFTWGFKSPREWWQAFRYDSKEYVAPTALVDLSKPAFRLGVAEVEVGLGGRELKVEVKADKEHYQVRQQAQVTIDVRQPDGKPAANAEIAVAAVDQALLELRPNRSWDLLRAMYQQRPWGVETATAQMEIVGRRHYGRKAVPAGGDGGGAGLTRELLDTLLLWNPRVQLDANGQAKLAVPLNDALTSFRIVAVADSGQDLFGTGETTIRSTQDLQIIGGLPPLVREGDQFRAQITLRNTTKKDMTVEVTPRASLLELKPQTVAIPAGGAQEVAWEVTAPVQLAFTRTQEILWEISAKDTAGSQAADALKLSQRIVPAVPVSVQQAMLVQVDGQRVDFAPPPGSLAEPDGKSARGGLKVTLQPSLAESLPSVRDWFANYPFVCLEQKTSKAIGLRDKALWQNILNDLPTYIDADGLASYFPPQPDSQARGSDTLTAYLLAVSHEAGKLDPSWQLPAALRDRMLSGLTRFVEGKLERKFWSPRPDLDQRKLAALEVLARYGQLQPRMLTSIAIAPNQWPTHTVIDWASILQRARNIPERNARYEEAMQILRSRLSYQGTQQVFSTERDDYWWWLMINGDVNGARLILTVLDDPAWKDDLPALVTGLLARQKQGSWATTNANLWGGLAVERFAAKTETAPVSGETRIGLGGKQETIDWRKVTRAPEGGKTIGSMGAAQAGFGAPPGSQAYINNSALLPWTIAGGGKPAALTLEQQGSGKPWATIQALAAVPLTSPFSAGYTIKKTVTPTQETVKGKVTRGDVWRVRLEINAAADMTWVVVSDPIPGGGTLLGSGLGRDSAIATDGEQRGGNGWLAFIERSFEAYRAYYEYLPKGKTVVEYTVRLNNAGNFNLPPTRAEALYAPEVFGATPNAPVHVELKP